MKYQDTAEMERAKTLLDLQEQLNDLKTPRPLEDWREEYGDVLWWVFPIQEAPYVGSPLYDDFPEYVTHWTPLPIPEELP